MEQNINQEKQEGKKNGVVSVAKVILYIQFVGLGAIIFLFIIRSISPEEQLPWSLLPFVLLLVFALPVLGIVGGIFSVLVFRKKKKVGLAIILLITSLIMIALIVAAYSDSGAAESMKKSSQEKSIAEERYEILSERFKIPQKVIDARINVLTLEGDVRVVLSSGISLSQRNKDQLVGNYVLVILPKKSYFLKSYCCYGKGGSNDYVYRAKVYFEGELLSDMF